MNDVRRIGPGRGSVIASLRELWGGRGLLRAIAGREFRVRYTQSILGVAWALAHPLVLMGVFTVVFGKIVHVGSEGQPYPLFSYAGLLPWTFLATGTTLAMRSLVAHVDLVTKVYFPRELLPLASLAASLVDFLIALGVFLLVFLAYGRVPGASWLWLAPLIMVQAVLAVGIALFTAALNVRFRDVKHVMPLMLQAWLYMSPVIYPMASVPDRLRGVFALNPMAGLVDGYRAVLLHGHAPDAALLLTSAAVSLLTLILGWAYFHRVEAYFADVI